MLIAMVVLLHSATWRFGHAPELVDELYGHLRVSNLARRTNVSNRWRGWANVLTWSRLRKHELIWVFRM